MNFNSHWNLKGKHALFGASDYHWINYSSEKMVTTLRNSLAKERGTALHELACQCIKLGIKLPKSKKTLNAYVNDAISYRMKPEQVLYYSDNFFGTADAIVFKEKEKFLRIHDLKTGTIVKARMEQLMIYAALFCLEYGYKPGEIECELRIYQNDEVMVYEPTVEDIAPIMDKIVSFDKIINEIKKEESERS